MLISCSGFQRSHTQITTCKPLSAHLSPRQKDRESRSIVPEASRTGQDRAPHEPALQQSHRRVRSENTLAPRLWKQFKSCLEELQLRKLEGRELLKQAAVTPNTLLPDSQNSTQTRDTTHGNFHNAATQALALAIQSLHILVSLKSLRQSCTLRLSLPATGGIVLPKLITKFSGILWRKPSGRALHVVALPRLLDNFFPQLFIHVTSSIQPFLTRLRGSSTETWMCQRSVMC